MSQTLTVEIPSGLYARLRERAEQTKRSVEVEMLEALNAHVPNADELPPEFEETLAALALLGDTDLERAAASRLAAEFATELESLHFKKQREGLTQLRRSVAPN
jgi:plasmid stability protein